MFTAYFWHNFPSGLYACFFTTLAMVTVGVVTLKRPRSQPLGLDQSIMQVLMLGAGGLLGISGPILAYTESRFTRWTETVGDAPVPTTPLVTFGLLGGAGVIAIANLVLTVRRKPRSLPGIVYSAMILSGIFTTIAQAAQFVYFTDDWALAVTIGWCVTGAAAFVLVIAGSVKLLRKRQRHTWYLDDRGRAGLWL
jgi:hypothetical protein